MSAEAWLRAVRAGYGPLEALHGVDLAFAAGRVTLLLGENGAGRTTALHVLAGLCRPTAGQVYWRGREISGLTPYRRARQGLALVPAERAVFPSLTVAEHLRGAEAPEGFGAALPSDRPAGQLSGGQQQLLALAVALARSPRLLLLDEPERGLAPSRSAWLHRELLRRAAAGTTVVLAAQRVPEALTADALVYVLHRGRVAFAGEARELA